MRLELSITFFQMFAAIFMSISYFRINSKIFKSCDRKILSDFNKLKRDLSKKIEINNKKSKSEKNKLLSKVLISFTIFICLLLSFIILTSFIPNIEIPFIINLFNNKYFLVIYFLLMIISIIYFFMQLYTFVNNKINILISKIHLFYRFCVYKLSRQSFISAIGFIFLFSSFFLDFINKTKILNSMTLNIVEGFALLFIIHGFYIFGIILKIYFEFKYNTRTSKIVVVKNTN